MNGTMPATVNSRDGSLETREAEGTAVWPLLTKKSIQRLVISCDFITWFLTLQYSLRSWFRVDSGLVVGHRLLITGVCRRVLTAGAILPSFRNTLKCRTGS